MPEEINQEAQVQGQQEKVPYEDLVRAYNALLSDRKLQEAQTRLGFCIEVLKLKKEFPSKYIKGIVKDVMTILPVEGLDIEKELSKKKTKDEE